MTDANPQPHTPAPHATPARPAAAVPISIVICCANSEATLDAACRSSRWAEELIVVDSGSTDETPQIARRYADQYVVEPWRGYSEQKQFAVELARNAWVLILDGDEECSPQLAGQLQALTVEELSRYDLLTVPRKNYIFGRYVRAWWPDRQTRVIHRHRITWSDEALHDGRLPSDPSRVRHLDGWLEHKRVGPSGFGDYFCGKRMDERLMMVARQMHERGKRATWFDLALRPAFAFTKFYFVKRGFLDGTFGLLIAQKAYVSTQLKYAALWAVQRDAGREGARGEGAEGG